MNAAGGWVYDRLQRPCFGGGCAAVRIKAAAFRPREMSARIGFGGGCHWCTEAVFQALRGVADVRQGFIASLTPDDGFSEAVIVTFDPAAVSLKTLISAHLITHASEADHKMRGKYRSAIYTFDPNQSEQAKAILARLAADTGAEFVTRVLPHRTFKESDTRFHNYYQRDPTRPFCQTYIDPKLAKLRRVMAAAIKEQS